LNHANLGWDYGLLRYIFNNPKMHIWHHSKEIPNKYGVNFGISLSIWDYLFNTNYIPKKRRDIELGFNDEQQFPKDFIKQELYPLKNN
jgi:sterol desaturase/sphingolipid hydroxylase (fatty acid hydroxylase superfamily)